MHDEPVFGTLSSMKLVINPRGNGACPLCALNGSCHLQRRLSDDVMPLEVTADDELEIVVYSCPYFTEKTAP